MKIEVDAYKGLVLNRLETSEKHQGITTGIDALPIYPQLTNGSNGVEHGEQQDDDDGDDTTPSSDKNDSNSPKGKKNKKSKQQKKLEREQKKIRISQRRLAKKQLNHQDNSKEIDDNPIITTQAIKKMYQKYHKDQEEKLIQYGTVALYTSDLTQILPGEWINDNIISIIYEFLIKSYIDQHHHKYIQFINPPVVQLMLYTDYDIINGSDYKDAKLIILPVNETMEGDHWFLIVINLLDNSLIVYDSMSGENNQLLTTIIEKLTKYKLINPKVKVINSVIEQQSNFDDCGVYLIMITCYIISMIIDNNIDLDLRLMKFNPLKARLDIIKLIDYLIFIQ